MNLRRPRAILALALALALAGCDAVNDLAAPDVPGTGPGASPGAIAAPAAPPRASTAPGAGTPVATRATARPARADGRPTDGTVWIDDGTDEWSMAGETYQAPRATADRPDDLDGHQIHALYLVPKDGADKQHDTRGLLGLSMAKMNRWFKGQTAGAQAFRFDTADDRPDVTFVRMAATTAELAASKETLDSHIADAVLANGFDDRRKLYLVFYDGPVTEEMGTPYGLNGAFPIVFLQEFADGGSHVTAQHELLHALGAVPACAPHSDGAAHIKDGSHDQMHGADLDEAAAAQPDDQAYDGPAQLDPGRDDYYGHGRPDCLDVARSTFLTPLAKDAAAEGDRVLAPYPAGGVPVPAPDLAGTDLVIDGLRLVPGPTGSGRATLVGQVAARAGSGRQVVHIYVDEAYGTYHLSLAGGRPRAFAIEVPTAGAHEVVLQARDGLAADDATGPEAIAIVRLADGAPAE